MGCCFHFLDRLWKSQLTKNSAILKITSKNLKKPGSNDMFLWKLHSKYRPPIQYFNLSYYCFCFITISKFIDLGGLIWQKRNIAMSANQINKAPLSMSSWAIIIIGSSRWVDCIGWKDTPITYQFRPWTCSSGRLSMVMSCMNWNHNVFFFFSNSKYMDLSQLKW
jgi:hypothetical protein